jgi:hypothetical protein
MRASESHAKRFYRPTLTRPRRTSKVQQRRAIPRVHAIYGILSGTGLAWVVSVVWRRRRAHGAYGFPPDAPVWAEPNRASQGVCQPRPHNAPVVGAIASSGSEVLTPWAHTRAHLELVPSVPTQAGAGGFARVWLKTPRKQNLAPREFVATNCARIMHAWLGSPPGPINLPCTLGQYRAIMLGHRGIGPRRTHITLDAPTGHRINP